MTEIAERSPVVLAASVSKIQKDTEKVLLCLADLAGSSVTDAVALDRAKAISIALYKEEIPESVLAIKKTVLNYLATLAIDTKRLALLARKIAGNFTRLRVGVALSGEPGSFTDWFIARVVGGKATKTKFKEIPGIAFTFECMTGLLTGDLVSSFFPEVMLNQMARRIGAVPRRFFDVVHYRQFVGLYLYIHVETTESATRVIEYQEPSATLLAKNRKLARSRDAELRSCPIKATWPCIFCGVSVSECPSSVNLAGVRVEMPCMVCGKKAEMLTTTCLECEERLWETNRMAV